MEINLQSLVNNVGSTTVANPGNFVEKVGEMDNHIFERTGRKTEWVLMSCQEMFDEYSKKLEKYDVRVVGELKSKHIWDIWKKEHVLMGWGDGTSSIVLSDRTRIFPTAMIAIKAI